MKTLSALLFLFTTIAVAQVGIGTITPNAQLDIQASNQATPANTDGLLIPKIDEFPVTDPTALQEGMMVYVTGAGSITKGFYYWDEASTSWITISGAKSIINLTDGHNDNFGSSVFLGTNAGSSDDGAQKYNVGVGSLSLSDNTVGQGNSAIGSFSLQYNINGNYNVAYGVSSLFRNESASFNTAIGTSALQYNRTGSSNTALGCISLRDNTEGQNNIAIGLGSLSENRTGDSNIAIGISSGSTRDNLSNNITIGRQAGISETNSNRLYIENSNSITPLIYGEFDNDVIGINGALAVGHQNPIVPFHVENEGTSGVQNIVAALGSNTSNRPVLQFSESSFTDLSAGMSLEYDGRGSGSANRMVINNVGGSPLFEFRNGGSLTLTGGSLYVNHPNGAGTEGITLVNTVDADEWKIYQQWNSNTLALFFNGANVGNFDDVSGAYTAVSDANRKRNIKPLNNVLENVRKLNVVDYNFINQKDTKKHIGLIAQDVEKVFPHLVVPPNEEVANYTMDYSGFGVLAIKAIQEQQEEIETLKAQLQQQKKELEAIKELLQNK